MTIAKNRAAVSPVIATILMVAITVVLAAVMMVMVMGFMNPVSAVYMGFFSDVEDKGAGEYRLTLGPVTSSIPLGEAKLRVNGVTSLLTLDNYNSSGNRFSTTDGKIQFYVYSQTGDGRFGTGNQIALFLHSSFAGTFVNVALVHHPGGSAIAFTSFMGPSFGDGNINLDGATSRGGAVPGFPLTLDSAFSQSVSVPQNTIPAVQNSFTVLTKVKLNTAPALQTSWATILNCNADNGYRLQLSGSTYGNSHFEFGNRGGWVRSDGMGVGGTGISIMANVTYTVMGVYNVSENMIKLYVNNSDGLLVLTGQKTLSSSPTTLGSSSWHLGGAGTSDTTNGRHFNGVIYSLKITVT